jgi:hypothetical protein
MCTSQRILSPSKESAMVSSKLAKHRLDDQSLKRYYHKDAAHILVGAKAVRCSRRKAPIIPSRLGSIVVVWRGTSMTVAETKEQSKRSKSEDDPGSWCIPLATLSVVNM